MSRCRMSVKNLEKKIKPLVPPEFTVHEALVRGGWQHGCALVFVTTGDGKKITGTVNYITGETFEPDAPPLNTWSELGPRKN